MPKFLKNIWFWIAIVLLVAFVVIPLACDYTIGFLNSYQWQADNVIGLLGVIGTLSAVGVAIWVPAKIAERQDKIALFEKRYEVYINLIQILRIKYLKGIDRSSQIMSTIATQQSFVMSDILELPLTQTVEERAHAILEGIRVTKIYRNRIEQVTFLFNLKGEHEIVDITDKILKAISFCLIEGKEVDKELYDMIETFEETVLPEIEAVLKV